MPHRARPRAARITHSLNSRRLWLWLWLSPKQLQPALCKHSRGNNRCLQHVHSECFQAAPSQNICHFPTTVICNPVLIFPLPMFDLQFLHLYKMCIAQMQKLYVLCKLHRLSFSRKGESQMFLLAGNVKGGEWCRTN